MELSRVFKNILCDTKHPSIAWCDQAANIVETLSGPNIWSLAFERSKELKNQGARPGDRISSIPQGKAFVIDFFAALIGHYVLVPNDSSPRGILPTPNSKALHGKGVLLELKTSGSTGTPKIRYYTRQSILLQLQTHSESFNYQEETERLAVLPWGHAFGLVLDLVLGLFSKSVIYCPIEEKLRGSRKWIAKMLDTYNIHHLSVIPRQLELILFYNRSTPRPPKVVFVGGASLGYSINDRCKSWLRGGEIIEGYGLTEAGPGVLLNGRAIGCEVKVQNGELYVRSESWSLNESLEVSTAWNPTQDLCVLAQDGTINVICRSSRQIKSSSGTWVNLAIIEENIAKTINARSVSICPSQEGLHAFLFVDIVLSETKKTWIAERLGQSTGLKSLLHEIVVDQTTESILERSRGKDLSHFFEIQQLV